MLYYFSFFRLCLHQAIISLEKVFQFLLFSNYPLLLSKLLAILGFSCSQIIQTSFCSFSTSLYKTNIMLDLWLSMVCPHLLVFKQGIFCHLGFLVTIIQRFLTLLSSCFGVPANPKIMKLSLLPAIQNSLLFLSFDISI